MTPRNTLIGQCAAWLDFLEEVEVYAAGDDPILLTGEPGEGKTQVAHHIHRQRPAPLCKQDFKHVSCAGLAGSLLESELFGHKKGAFTGASHNHSGILRSAGQGTAFFDELGEFTLAMQSKILLAIEESSVKPVGQTSREPIECFWVLATWRDIDDPKIIRADLKRRIPIRLTVPPLRERRDDIPLLAEHFAQGVGVDKDAVAHLQALPWQKDSGGVGELRGMIRKARLWTLRRDADTITLDDIKRATGKRKRRGRHQIDDQTLRVLLGFGDDEWGTGNFIAARGVGRTRAHALINGLLKSGSIARVGHGTYCSRLSGEHSLNKGEHPHKARA